MAGRPGHRVCPRGSPAPPPHCFLHTIPDCDWGEGGAVNALQPIASAGSPRLRNRRRSTKGTRGREAKEKPRGRQGLRGRAAGGRSPRAKQETGCGGKRGPGRSGARLAASRLPARRSPPRVPRPRNGGAATASRPRHTYAQSTCTRVSLPGAAPAADSIPGVRGRTCAQGPTHVEAGLLHQQLGVHQVHIRRAGRVFQQAHDDRRAQAVPGILQGCAWGTKEATGRSLFTEPHRKGRRPLAPSLGSRAPRGPVGPNSLLPRQCCLTLGSGESAR